MAEQPKKLQFNWKSITDNIAKSETKGGGGGKYNDERFYKPRRNESGNGEVKMRFLPPKDMETIGNVYVRIFEHSIESLDGGKWMFEYCRKNLGDQEPCPIDELFFEYYHDSNKNMTERLRQVRTYISNVLILKDPVTPANEGKVFLYKYGPQIHQKVIDTMIPPKGSTDDPIQVYDPYEGATFKLKIKTKKLENGDTKVPSYEDSSFEGKSCLDDAVVENAMAQVYNLGEFMPKPEMIKSYDELKVKLDMFLNKGKPAEASAPATTTAPTTEEKTEMAKSKETAKTVEAVAEKAKATEKATKMEEKKADKPAPALNLDEDDDDFFKKVRN